MEKPLRVGLFILAACFSMFIGASVGVAIQAARVTAAPQSFISLAKLVAGGQMVVGNESKAQLDPASLESYFQEALVALEGEEIGKRAADRVRAIHPELHQIDLKVKASRNPGSAIIKFRAFGAERNHTRIFLDAVVDEFMVSRQDAASSQAKLPAFKVMERASPPVEDLPDWIVPIFVGVVVGGLGGLFVALFIGAWVRPRNRAASPPELPRVEA